MIELKFTGNAKEVRAEMAAMLLTTVDVVSPKSTALTQEVLGVAARETGGGEKAELDTSTTKRPSGRTRAANAAKEAETSKAVEQVVEETAETSNQDAADEKAEVETAGAKLTHDDIRAKLGEYVKKFGMAAAQEDGPKVIKLALKSEVEAISKIPDEQPALKAVLNGISEMLEKNPFKRTEVKAS